MTTQSERYVSAFDLHWPQSNIPTVKAMFSFLRQNRVDGFVFGGDQFDNECISHHTKGKPEFRETGQFLLDEKTFNGEILVPLELLLPEGAAKIWITGNHDYWEQEYEQENAELKGRLQRPLNLDLAARGWRVISLGGFYRHGKMTWVHGEGIGTAHHAKRAVEVYCTNLNYGHHHSLQAFTKVLSTDFRQKWVAQCNPILGDTNPRYCEGKPNAWVNGFTVTEFHGKAFNNYPVVVTDGECSYGGKLYSGLTWPEAQTEHESVPELQQSRQPTRKPRGARQGKRRGRSGRRAPVGRR